MAPPKAKRDDKKIRREEHKVES